MRLCADENVPGDCVAWLRKKGHDVLWIREWAPGSSDTAVLSRAFEEKRLLVTFDKDFGELVFRSGANASHGILLIRFIRYSSKALGERVAAVLESRDDWWGHFTVVDDQGIRMRRLTVGD